MQKWEYNRLVIMNGKVTSANGKKLVAGSQGVEEHHLELFGLEGWELAGVSSGENLADRILYFKRPIP